VGRLEAGHLVVGHRERQALDGSSHESGREDVAIDPVVLENRIKRFDLHAPNCPRKRGYLCLQRRAVVGSRRQLDQERVAARIGGKPPPGSQRFT